ncbi:putative protein-disulfide isomerase [Streptococcus gallinaceus]|uniref:DsbA family protein n=1 Tax=Streptococcus gallinaceus TaxID=165758 RepID=UPI00209E6B43|nr:DsbA family protein [Streptococcus gallinaceus]MCP1639622.1 putative protein-disulfide isomerase [Streptococcus gallinaceus]MCP1770405.1 putative protein-disulfide isomerase [Streptococcus gallinaceus]
MMKVYYIWDAYCGWCYGFGAVLLPFMKAHPELDMEVISGGLFDRGASLSQYPHLPEANQQIQELFGVTFGSTYEKLLEVGDLVLSSNDAAIGYGLLRDQLPMDKHLDLAQDLQMAFYQDGKSLSDVATYTDLAQAYGLEEDSLAQAFLGEQASGKNHSDIAKARAFGVQSYPTLLIEKNGKIYDLRSEAMTLEELESHYRLVQQMA